jgi:hypothetical protein
MLKQEILLRALLTQAQWQKLVALATIGLPALVGLVPNQAVL